MLTAFSCLGNLVRINRPLYSLASNNPINNNKINIIITDWSHRNHSRRSLRYYQNSITAGSKFVDGLSEFSIQFHYIELQTY